MTRLQKSDFPRSMRRKRIEGMGYNNIVNLPLLYNAYLVFKLMGRGYQAATQYFVDVSESNDHEGNISIVIRQSDANFVYIYVRRLFGRFT